LNNRSRKLNLEGAEVSLLKLPFKLDFIIINVVDKFENKIRFQSSVKKQFSEDNWLTLRQRR